MTAGAALGGVTTASSANISVTGPAAFVNVTNGGKLTIAAGSSTPIPLTLFTNQGSGSVTVAAGSRVSATDFQTYGVLTLAPAIGPDGTQLTNFGATPLYFNGGSRTFIGTPATVSQ